MGHPPRYEEAAAIHHVFARGNRRQDLYRDDRDRWTYLAMLGSVVRRCRWRCLAFCLMDNHVHLLLETSDPNLGVGMQRLHAPYAKLFNQRHGTVGHVFQGRYRSKRIKDDVHLITTLRYIASNPVAAGLCAAEEDWPWSSHAMLLGGTVPHWLDGARVRDHLAAWGNQDLRHL
jgi:putative transposase